ncbi:MAG: hypothetical protein ABIK50_04585, partial [candidate division WOR-3 bacterium]
MLQKFEKKFKKDHWDKLLKIKNKDLFSFLSFYLELLNPKEIYLVTEESDFDYIKKRALET